jgi:hypothetical protein
VPTAAALQHVGWSFAILLAAFLPLLVLGLPLATIAGCAVFRGLWAVLFGTWHDPGHMPDRIGLTEPFARSYLGALVEPLVPGRWHRR